MTINQNKEHKRKQTLAREPIITFCPFVHAPSNEIEVTMLFASLAERLGYWIISCNKSYPDCHAIKKVNDPNSHEYEHVIIEFEYRSSNFLDHQHNPSDCDLIVCWIDDDKDNRIPVEKLELRSIFKRLNEECERRISNLSF